MYRLSSDQGFLGIWFPSHLPCHWWNESVYQIEFNATLLTTITSIKPSSPPEDLPRPLLPDSKIYVVHF
jgi:hypothetical protein